MSDVIRIMLLLESIVIYLFMVAVSIIRIYICIAFHICLHPDSYGLGMDLYTTLIVMSCDLGDTDKALGLMLLWKVF
jgi:hypothetical protein